MRREEQRAGARTCRQEKAHRIRPLYSSDGAHIYNYCTRCGWMGVPRAALLAELLTGINALFGIEYSKYMETPK